MSQTETKNNYRATFILDTRGVDTPVGTLIEKLTGVVTELEGEVARVENLGRKEFSRVTERGHNEDYFVQIEYSAPVDLTIKLQDNLRLDKSVKRVFVETAG